MNHKILIAYASRCGSTQEVAQAIAEELSLRGMPADVRLADQVSDLSPYSAVIVGSGIRVGQWLPAARDFVKNHQAQLQNLPTAFFCVHANNLGSDEASAAARAAYLAPIREMVQPGAEAWFAGKIDPTQMSFIERMMMKAVKAQPGDFRDWTAIRAWGQQIFA